MKAMSNPYNQEFRKLCILNSADHPKMSTQEAIQHADFRLSNQLLLTYATTTTTADATTMPTHLQAPSK